MQDIEFTVEEGRLWMLQTRSGKRTAKAAIRIAVDMARDGVITREEAVQRVDPSSLDQLLHPTIDPKAERNEIARGLPASPGAASGEIASGIYFLFFAAYPSGQGESSRCLLCFLIHILLSATLCLPCISPILFSCHLKACLPSG